ncbi:hypothetical protein BLNAU_14168 [Blattamonas nauphoetae]|uniref:Uncharacterized protein n=1 Tax=Blattamonas nauphoetae TaxID=2049346 RepID=A0ABQ9XFX9_9EUKA|nr:hypothetical protein BLNAU_14168 [Blattamonas nauphoetae]
MSFLKNPSKHSTHQSQDIVKTKRAHSSKSRQNVNRKTRKLEVNSQRALTQCNHSNYISVVPSAQFGLTDTLITWKWSTGNRTHLSFNRTFLSISPKKDASVESKQRSQESTKHNNTHDEAVILPDVESTEEDSDIINSDDSVHSTRKRHISVFDDEASEGEESEDGTSSHSSSDEVSDLNELEEHHFRRREKDRHKREKMKRANPESYIESESEIEEREIETERLRTGGEDVLFEDEALTTRRLRRRQEPLYKELARKYGQERAKDSAGRYFTSQLDSDEDDVSGESGDESDEDGAMTIDDTSDLSSMEDIQVMGDEGYELIQRKQWKEQTKRPKPKVVVKVTVGKEPNQIKLQQQRQKEIEAERIFEETMKENKKQCESVGNNSMQEGIKTKKLLQIDESESDD